MRSATALSTLFAGSLVLLAGCATAPVDRPVEVLRYHVGNADIARGTIAIDPGPAAANGVAVDYRAYADAVQAELVANGYTLAAPGSAARYTASIGFNRGGRPAPDNKPRFSIGLGGGSFGRHGGIGGGVGVPVSGNRVREVIGTELSVRINESGAAGAGVLWEGRANTEADSRLEVSAPEVAARKLAHALFQGFPGESGRTITVK